MSSLFKKLNSFWKIGLTRIAFSKELQPYQRIHEDDVLGTVFICWCQSLIEFKKKKNMVILINSSFCEDIFVWSVDKWEYKSCWASSSNIIINISVNVWPRNEIWQWVTLFFLSSSLNPPVYGGRTKINKHTTPGRNVLWHHYLVTRWCVSPVSC